MKLTPGSKCEVGQRLFIIMSCHPTLAFNVSDTRQTMHREVAIGGVDFPPEVRSEREPTPFAI